MPGDVLCVLSLKLWNLVDIILMIFLIINWPNFVYLCVDPGFLSPPLRFLWSIVVRSPYITDASERHDGKRDKRTDGRAGGRTQRRVSSSVRSFVRLIDGVRHKTRKLARAKGTQRLEPQVSTAMGKHCSKSRWTIQIGLLFQLLCCS